MRAAINGISMTFDVSGPASAPPVVLHHPIANNLSTWDELTTALHPGFRVIRFDARGHGATEAQSGAYDFETLAADVVGLMDHLGISRARFLGLSMGGMVGQYLGRLYPDRFHSLVLVSTASKVPEAAVPLWDERIRTVAASGMQSAVQGSLPRWFAPRTLESRPDLIARLTAMIVSTPADGYIGWCHAIRGLDTTGWLGTISLPTLIVVGKLDPASPPAAAEAVHHAIAGSRLVVMDGVSHMLHVEAPEDFHAAVRPFLNAHGPSR
jgi:3-oxoadipate enol-lactonase